MVTLEVSLTCKKQNKIAECEFWGREYEESLPNHASPRNPEHAALGTVTSHCDAILVDRYDNMVTNTGYAP